MTPLARRQEIAATAAMQRWLYVDPHTGRELSADDRKRAMAMERAGCVAPRKPQEKQQ